jgi:tRNA pseudouridine38-40 synthase
LRFCAGTAKHIVPSLDILDMSDRVAVKFAYDGTRFMGSQRQPRSRTVEGELIAALVRIGAMTSPERDRFRVASRTDRGVSALGNVFAVDTGFRRQELLAALNANCLDVHCYALAEVPDNFSPRRAKGRWYRYHLPHRGQDLPLMEACAREFPGLHEFRLFCKPEGRVTMRTLDSVNLSLEGDTVIIDLQAREFLRNMVRRIVHALDQVGQGRTSLEEVRSALLGRGRPLGMAKAEGLFLMDVDHELRMCPGPLGPLPRRLEEGWRSAQLATRFYGTLMEYAGLTHRS